ncbi:MAG TPA: hypothetical protein VLT32_00555, partial [Candidatus Sulfomarinibacteraceae bacterium]|nr:hypothetical protein [Candidatus Sulfomarinibacteraceae bacterium]
RFRFKTGEGYHGNSTAAVESRWLSLALAPRHRTIAGIAVQRRGAEAQRHRRGVAWAAESAARQSQLNVMVLVAPS